MKIYFLRHGEADWPNWEGPDDDRPLTKKGRKEMRRVAEFLADLGVAPDLILTSPLPRSAQTAELASEPLKMETITEPGLAPGFNVDELMKLLDKYKDKDVMLVGHEPDFSSVIQALSGGNVKLSKAGLARVDVDNSTHRQGCLMWLLSPKFAKL